MLSFKLVFYLVALYAAANAYVAIQEQEEKPAKYANEEGCYISQLDRVLEFDKPYTPTDGSCVKYTCRRGGDTHIEGCSAIGVGKGCEKAPGNRSLPYPKCCDGVRCKAPNGTYIEDFPY